MKTGDLVCLKKSVHRPTILWDWAGVIKVGEMTNEDIGIVVSMRTYDDDPDAFIYAYLLLKDFMGVVWVEELKKAK